MNIKATFTNYPWKRCLESMKNGTADVLISALKSPDREEYMLYPETNISISKTVLFTVKNKKILYTGSLEQLKGYTLGVIMGFTYGETFDNAVYLRKDEAVDTQTLITKLVNGRNDVIAENQAVVTAIAKDMGVITQLTVLKPPIHTQKLYVCFSRSHDLESVCNNFSIQLLNFKTTKTYAAILAKYGLGVAEMLSMD